MTDAYRKINWKLLNLAFWAEMILSYFLPFKVTDGNRCQAGFPVPFISFNAGSFDSSPFMSMHVNPLGLIFDGIVIYIMMTACIKAHQKINQFLRK